MISAKHASLIAGVFQQALLVLIIRYSRTRHIAEGQDASAAYLTSVAVASSEVLKIVLNGILEIKNDPSGDQHDSSSMVLQFPQSKSFGKRSLRVLKGLFNVYNKESAKLIVPAALYLLQNNLLFVALANLSVPTYQLTNQGKLLITAIISRIVLKKYINGMQYLSIALLGLGVAVTHLSEYYQNMNQQAENASITSPKTVQNQWLGLAAVMISCVTSGFASVYFELILKTGNKSKQSVHFKNFQLAVWSFLLAAIHIICSKDLPLILKHGLFHGFDGVILMVVVAQTMTGFVVSMMLYYADSILKGFAVSVAAVLATVLSVFIFDTKINELFFAGAFLVGIAVAMYSFYEGKNNIAATPFQEGNRLTRRKRNKCRPSTTTGAKRMHRHTPMILMLILVLVCALSFSMSVISNSNATNLMDWDNLMTMDDVLKTSYNSATEKNNIVAGGNATDIDGIVGGDNNGKHVTSTFPVCTKEASYRPRPDDVSVSQYRKVFQAEDVTAFIVDELSKIGVPVTIMFGTMLHEYRNATGPCIQSDFKDKDLDIAVFARHFHHVIALIDKIQRKFGWRLDLLERTKMVIVLLPPGQVQAQIGFQIDIYGFECKRTSKKLLINLPWDNVSLNMNEFLPLLKHKTPVYNDTTRWLAGQDTGPRQLLTLKGEPLYMHAPFSPPCLLSEMYGADFMTPHEGKKSEKVAYEDTPKECMKPKLTSAQREELQRQLSFC